MVLEHFNALAFVGDDSARMIYGAFNILLRGDLKYGTVREWKMGPREKKDCQCMTMFLPRRGGVAPRDECESFQVMGSYELMGAGGSRYHCSSEFCRIIKSNRR
jgi:hypothetical protein